MTQNERPTYCTKCGAKLGKGLQFCTSCGEPVTKIESSHAIEEKEELLPPTAARNRKVAIALVSALATVALVLGVVWLFRGGNAESEETASVSDVASATEPAAASNVNTPAKTTSEQQPKETSASEAEPSSPAGNDQSTNASQETREATNTPGKDGLYAFNYSGSYTSELDIASLQQIVSSGPVASGDAVASNCITSRSTENSRAVWLDRFAFWRMRICAPATYGRRAHEGMPTRGRYSVWLFRCQASRLF